MDKTCVLTIDFKEVKRVGLLYIKVLAMVGSCLAIEFSLIFFIGLLMFNSI